GMAYTWETTAPLVLHGSEHRVAVPIGARTNWGSVPPIFRWLIDPMDGAAATLVHDYAYRVLCPRGELTYQAADNLLLEGLTALGTPLPSALLTWAGVRLASTTTRPGGRVDLRQDLPLLAMVTGPGFVLAASALAVAPSMGALALANYVSRVRSTR
ncbi:MAG: DUF1353 domain-containing protein, partial [Pseudonocardiaceae bacterium]